MKLIFENWRRYLNEELLNELSFEDVEKRFNSKKFLKAVNGYGVTFNYAKEQLLARIPKDITEKDKAGALNWLISLFIKDPRKVFSDPEGRPVPRVNVAGDLELFFQIKQQNLARFLDIRSLPRMESVSELAKVVDAAKELYKKHMEKKDYLDAEQGKLKIFENDEYTAFIPTNKGAACELGKGTEWCTAAPGLDYYEEYHRADDPLIIFKSKTDPKKDAQLHFGSEQFMDVNDEPLEDEHVMALVSLLKGNKYLPKNILDLINKMGVVDIGRGRTVVTDLEGKKWYLNGQLHREDGPAIEYTSGTKAWYLNGKLHREDGPAIEFGSARAIEKWYGFESLPSEGAPIGVWYLNGELHREDGPAQMTILVKEGTYLWIQEWYLNGKLHREDGPAIIYPDGSGSWYLDGKRYPKEQYEEEMKSRKGEEG